MNYEQKLQSYIQQNNIVCEHLIFQESCHSVDDACKASGAQRDEFVKNICMIDKNGNLIVGILKGEDKLDTKKVEVIVGSKIRMAKPDEVIEKTGGYICGGVPSFGFEANFLIDKKVFEREIVYSGGGSDKSLIKINPNEIINHNRGKVVEIVRTI